MDDPLSRGLPFELVDIWRRSALQVKDADRSLFTPLDASLPPLELEVETKNELFANQLVIPPIETADDFEHPQHLEPPESDIASPRSKLWDTGQASQDDQAGVWDLDLDLNVPPGRPPLRTWEAFEKKDVPNSERTGYLSEAGPPALDALLAQCESHRSGVLPRDVTLRALCNLVLGRASAFFQWDERKAGFTRTLEDVPISGYSSATCDGLVGGLMEYATRFRSLRASSSQARAKRSAQPCAIAFHGAITGILDAIEEQITNDLPQIQSHLQLQALIERPSWLLVTLERMGSLVRNVTSDEGVISALSDHVHEAVSADNSFATILRYVLERTSAPWLEQLAKNVGLADDLAFAATTQSGEDINTSATDLGSSTVHAIGGDHEILGFMGDKDRKLVKSTRTNLRVLRQTLPHHAVSEQARHLYQRAIGSGYGRDPVAHPTEMTDLDTGHAPEGPILTCGEESSAWADGNVQSDYLAQMDMQMSVLPHHHDHENNSLRGAVLFYCSADPELSDLNNALVPDISPIDRLRPALLAQSYHLNRCILQHLFKQGLAHHLQLQNDYHFLHSGEFATHLSNALFSTAETQSAERKRGTIPTGQTMGLRLGDAARNEQRWPPASSELRLTLADVLTETYKTDHPSRSAKVSKELPGGLSFSIRELPDAEIERVMDASSIYALDFLKLQYTPPPPLDAIFTSSAMQAYDAVFRLLVRVLRALHVTTALTRAVANRHRVSMNNTISPVGVRFAQRTHAFISTLSSHMSDLGIAAPWATLTRRVRALESSLQSATSDSVGEATDLETFKSLHQTTLETIRSRLFLRRKQEKLRVAVEEVLSAILRGAVVLEGQRDGGDADVGDVLSGFDAAAKELLKLLRAAVDKPPKMKSLVAKGDVGDEDEVETLRVLLGSLEWNGFYALDETMGGK